MLCFAPVFALFAVIPVGQAIPVSAIPGLSDAPDLLGKLALQVANPDVGLLYVFAISSLAVYGTSLAGWSSNNKLAILGGVRAASQMISYEVSLGLSLVGCMLAYRTLRLEDMVVAQGAPVIGSIPALGILLQPIGFLIFFASAFAETKRAPFDLPEGESEIVGYFVEYSGMKFGLMFLAEFAEIVVLSGILTAVFLGGWHPIFFESTLQGALSPFWFAALGGGVFLAKMILMMWLQLTVRWLLPRFRFDHIEKLCWKILLPAALANVFITAAVALYDPEPHPPRLGGGLDHRGHRRPHRLDGPCPGKESRPRRRGPRRPPLGGALTPKPRLEKRPCPIPSRIDPRTFARRCTSRRSSGASPRSPATS